MRNMTAVRKYLNTLEVATRYTVDAQLVRKLYKDGRFPCPIRVGRFLRWRVRNLDAWDAEQVSGGAAQ